MSQTSRSRIRAEGSTQRQVMTEIPRQTRRSDTSSGYTRSSGRHAAVVEKLEIAVSVLLEDAEEAKSRLGAFPGVLELAVSRFLGDRARREHRRGVISSTRRGHFMDSRDRGRSTRDERELASKEYVKARQVERDLEYLNRGA